VALVRAFATRADDEEFSRFSCWDGNSALPWVEEVEDDIRGGWIFKRAEHVVAIRDDGDLVAVSAFFPRDIGLPVVAPVPQLGWHLHALAVRLDLQRSGLSVVALEQTFAAMREIDPNRDLFTVRVHQDNVASTRLCGRYQLAPFPRDDPVYIELLGDVGS
jgi:hypothetical protein